MYDARYRERQRSRVSSDLVNPSSNSSTTSPLNFGAMFTLLERAKRDEDAKDQFIREVSIHPSFSCVLADSLQLTQMAMFCSDETENSVFCVDPTFYIFLENLCLTVSTYRNLKLVVEKTGKHPVFIGPLFIHQRKDWKTYNKFFRTIVAECPDRDTENAVQNMVAIGMDGEKALFDGCKRVFTNSNILHCFIHFQRNIERQLLTRSHLSRDKVDEIIYSIMGRQYDDAYTEGLVDASFTLEYDLNLTDLCKEWDLMEADIKEEDRFIQWFKTYESDVMRDHMLRCVRTEAGLGDDPVKFTTNDVEAGNFLIKHGLNFSPSRIHEFILQIKDIISTQFRNEQRAVFKKGIYRLAEGFKHLESSRVSMPEKQEKLAEYFRTGVNGRQEFSPLRTEVASDEEEVSGLSENVISSGITSVPAPILDHMFERAEELLALDNHTQQHVGDANTYLVFDTRKDITVTRLRSGTIFSCGNKCLHQKTRICEHTIAVAEKCGVLREFLNWYAKSKHGSNMQTFAISNGTTTKSIGSKPGT